MMKPYVELQVTSNFSFLQGASHPEELVSEAARLGYSAIGIADEHSLAGVVRAHVSAKNAGIQALIGTRVRLSKEVERRPEEREPLSFLLYPTSRASYGRLSSLLTRGKLRAPKGQCYLKLSDLADFEEGLLAIAVLDNLKKEQFEDRGVKTLLEQAKEIFSRDRLSLAMSSSYLPHHQAYLARLRQLSQGQRIPLVVTNNVFYHNEERRVLQDVLTCIRHGVPISKAGFLLYQNAERHIKTIAEMNRLFRNYPQALHRSSEIAEQAKQFSLEQLRYEYPKEVCPAGKTPPEYLRELVIAGCREHYPKGLPKTVAEQIKRELALIRELDYEKYFLTVHDIVRFARSRNILCQGRGAAANSAVCFVLGITAVDPAQIHLLFERFISKERNEPPDIDIDFEHERREEVIQYIYEKYGRLRAALTAEVISYRTRSALRDVGKVFGLSLETIETLIRLKTRSPLYQKAEQDKAKAEATLPHCSQFAIPREKFVEHGVDPEDRAVQLTLELSEVLRSFPRHLSQHVGGFIVSDPPLCEIVPIENAAMPGRTVIEWDKDDIEHLGMLKIDVLALGMLTCIRKALELVEAGGQKFTLANVPREDRAVYEMICRADTIGVFQIESRAQMTMLPRLRPKCFYDLVIEVAIVRPGPIQGGMVHPFLRRRQGLERAEYPNQKIKQILERTLGVPIFQEQVMELAVVAAGFTGGEADQLRRAMASWKKNANALLRFERRLKEGMAERGYQEKFADQVFEQMKGFGEYGFPQSHAASFAHLVYVSAWLKHYYPAHFAAGLINSLPMGFYQPAQIIQDAKQHGVEVREIDVNKSAWDCTLENDQVENQAARQIPKLRLGMRLVKGIQKKEIEKLVQAVRASGPFRSVLLLWRASRARVQQLKALAHADAFSSLGVSRQDALWQIKKLRDEHLPLFEQYEEEEEQEVNLPQLSERLHVIRDYQSFGLSLKAHPMQFLRSHLEPHGVQTIEAVKNAQAFPQGRRVAISGIVLVRQRPHTASGTMFMTLEDETGMTNLIIWPKILESFPDALLDSRILVATGRIQRESEVLHLVVESVLDISASYLSFESQSRDFH